ncbi:MAG TPA: 16S rRNA processing protein RimM [Nitratifractor sp.]|nr:16S rRNA processing protein RimM [Nitratifractor sp.]
MQTEDNFLVAQFGRAVGLKGELKLNLHTDFPEQFKVGRVLSTNRGPLTIQNYNPKRNLIKIVGIDTPEDAKRITNAKVFSSKEETLKYCNLKKGQYFWFDLIGCSIVEDSEVLGVVSEIQRLPQGDYFLINTDEKLIQSGMAKSFLLPYLPHFVKNVDIEQKIITVSSAKDILEAS